MKVKISYGKITSGPAVGLWWVSVEPGFLNAAVTSPTEDGPAHAADLAHQFRTLTVEVEGEVGGD